MTKKKRAAENRRDRRKAKQSKWRREGTKNPKKVAHHASDERAMLGAPTKRRVKHKKATQKKKALKPADGELSPLITKAEAKKFLNELGKD